MIKHRVCFSDMSNIPTEYYLPSDVEEMKKEFIERYKDLLGEAMNRYEYAPHPFMKPVDEYYREEIKYLEGLK